MIYKKEQVKNWKESSLHYKFWNLPYILLVFKSEFH